MRKPLKYFLLGILFWFIVDFTTTEAIRNPGTYYSTFMPALLIFYIGYPLIFSLLIYKFKLKNTSLFFAVLLGIMSIEIVFTHNVLLFTFPIMILAIPVAISLYSFITFVPKWIGRWRNKKIQMATYTTEYRLYFSIVCHCHW